MSRHAGAFRGSGSRLTAPRHRDAGAGAGRLAADQVVTGSTDEPDYRQRHPIVLTKGARTLDVFVTGHASLDGRQRDDLRAFAAVYRRSGQGASWRRCRRRAQRCRRARHHGAHQRGAHGMRPAAGYVAVSAGDASLPPSVRYAGDQPLRMAAMGQRCREASHDILDFGCAMQSNVAAQVADPVDLVRPAPRIGGCDPSRQGHRRRPRRSGSVDRGARRAPRSTTGSGN